MIAMQEVYNDIYVKNDAKKCSAFLLINFFLTDAVLTYFLLIAAAQKYNT